MKKKMLFLFSLSVFCLIAAGMFADDKGAVIAKSFFNLKKAADSSVTGTMSIYDSKDNMKVRKLKMLSMDKNGKKASYTEFLQPADVKGTKFLSISNPQGGDDDQRIYLPALKKVKKIASGDKSGRFVGSDLSYYDLQSKTFDDFSYTYIKDDVYNGKKCSLVEMIAKKPSCPYSKSIAWIAADDHFIYQYELYDKTSGEKIKTIENVSVKMIDDVIISDKIIANNYRDGGRTEMVLEDIKLNTGVSESAFSVQNLEK